MYTVNLLPDSYIRDKRNQRIKNRVIYGLLILFVVILVVYRFLLQLEYRQEEQLKSISQANLNLEDTIQRLSDPNTLMANATEIDSIIGDIERSNVDYVQMIVLIGNSAPDDVLISYLSMSGADGDEACIINASAQYYKSVSEWISALSEIEGLGSITFSYLARGEVLQGGYEPGETSDQSETDRINFEFRIALN